jgi:MoaA/NifB/PqqE/SkfB family radical SAM enzyme
MTYIAPRTKVLWHIDRLAAIRDGKRPPPINVEIDLSNRCSLGCEWCHFAYTHTRGPLAKSPKLRDAIPGGDLMDTDLAKSIVRQMAQAGVKSIVWTGGGEPTLHPDFDEVISYAASQYYMLQQGIYTNGAHIDDARAALLKSKLAWINVSLDAVSAQDYRLTKVANLFDKVCGNIERLAKADGDAVIGVSFLITESNAWQIDKMVDFGLGLGANYVYLRPTILYDQDRPSARIGDLRWINKALDDLEGWNGYPFVIVDPNRFKMYRDWDGHGYDTCWWSGVQTVVTPNGKMWTCVNKREHPAALVGDLSQDDFMTIWNSTELAQVDESCRVMCRGHLGNLTLDKVMNKPQHAEFV